MIKHLAAILNALPEDMPHPTVKPNDDHGLFLTWNHNSMSAYVLVLVTDDGDTRVNTWSGWMSLTDPVTRGTEVIRDTSVVPAELLALLNDFARVVRESQREQVTA